MFLEFMSLVAWSIHIGVPLAYYAYLKRHVHRPWRLRLECNFTPTATVLIPTFDEAALIERKLEDIKAQFFPREKLDVVVVDSGSTDGTADIVSNWAMRNRELKVTVLRESDRKGKAYALNSGLDLTTGDIVVITDADSAWSLGSLKEAASYFSDRSVGAVTALKEPLFLNPQKRMKVEFTYRSFYNVVRMAESKIHSTPVFHGELAAFRTDLLRENGGFRTSVGADDSHTATSLSLRGFRAIAIPEALAYELTPTSWLGYLRWKKRRAIHLVQHFTKLMRKLRKAPRDLRKVMMVEIFLHVFNPWLFVAACAIFLLSVLQNGFSLFHLGIILAVGITQFVRGTRDALKAWVTEQLILAYASLSGLFSSELIWPKINELRTLG